MSEKVGVVASTMTREEIPNHSDVQDLSHTLPTIGSFGAGRVAADFKSKQSLFWRTELGRTRTSKGAKELEEGRRPELFNNSDIHGVYI